jgi:flagellar assembly factor FliW
MQIQTTRFGTLDVDDDRLITFPRGLIGFGGLRQFASVSAADNPRFSWLQSAEDPEVAFLVVDPSLFFKEYDVSVREDTEQELAISNPADARLLVICNKAGDWLTGNLLGPIVLNVKNRAAQQVVLTEKKWTTRQPLARIALDTPMPLARAA